MPLTITGSEVIDLSQSISFHVKDGSISDTKYRDSPESGTPSSFMLDLPVLKLANERCGGRRNLDNYFRYIIEHIELKNRTRSFF